MNVIKVSIALVIMVLGAGLPASSTVAGVTSAATIATAPRPHLDSAARLERRWGDVVASEHLRQPARLPMAPGVTYQPPRRQRAHVNYGDMDEVGYQGSIGQCQCYAWQRLFDALYFTARGVHTRLSCRMQYALTQKPPGSDQGSYFAQYVTLTKDVGWVTTATYDYYGVPNTVPKKVPTKVLQAAIPHRYAVEVKTIARAVGGMNAVYGVMHAIAGGRQVNVAAPVFEGPGANSFYDIEKHSGCIDLPGPKATDGGGHATAFYGYDMAAKPKDCSGCYLLAVNSWGKNFGVGRDGNAAPPGKRGYYKMSCRFAAQHAWGLESIKTSAGPPKTEDAAIPVPANTALLPAPAGWQVRPVKAGEPFPLLLPQGRWWARSFTAADAKTVDLGLLANRWGKRYDVRPTGILATLLAECGGVTDQPATSVIQPCDRPGGSAFLRSHGACGLTTATAKTLLGVTSDTAAKRALDDASTCVRLTARVFAILRAKTQVAGCPLTFPDLAITWLSGPARPCDEQMNPQGRILGQYTRWAGWWNYVNARFGRAS